MKIAGERIREEETAREKSGGARKRDWSYRLGKRVLWAPENIDT